MAGSLTNGLARRLHTEIFAHETLAPQQIHPALDCGSGVSIAADGGTLMQRTRHRLTIHAHSSSDVRPGDAGD